MIVKFRLGRKSYRVILWEIEDVNGIRLIGVHYLSIHMYFLEKYESKIENFKSTQSQ